MILKQIKIINNKINESKQIYDVKFVGETKKSKEVSDADCFPFCSVVIGVNGAGKSFLLSQIADLFSKDKHRYTNYESEYEINGKSHKIVVENNNNNNNNNNSNQNIRVLAISFLLNDKFTFQKKSENNNYRYLGIRNSSNAAFFSNIEKSIIEQLLSEDIADKISFIKNMLNLMGLDEKCQLKIELVSSYRYKKIKRDIFIKKIEEKIKNLKDKKKKYKTFKNQEILDELSDNSCKKVIDFLTNLYDKTKDGKPICIDLLNNQSLDITKDMFDIIWSLGIVSHNMLILYKNGEDFMFEWAASGEKQLLYTFIKIRDNITDNSLILIDEPETSLHPNWQMRYVSFLKEAFKGYKCHFILATHSPHLISDLESNSSSVIVLERNKENIIEQKKDYLNMDTYAWSAENILYNVFKVRTTRNYYFENDLNKLTELLADTNPSDSNIDIIRKLYEKLDSYVLDENDPLREFLTDIGRNSNVPIKSKR